MTVGLVYDRTERDDVSDYIEEVNAAQRATATRFGSINQAYAQFRLDPAQVESQLPRLREAARTIAEARRRIAAVDAPEEAGDLRKRLLEYYEQQELVARELVAVLEYLPVLQRAERSVALANRHLRASLAGGGDGAADVQAVTTYAARLGAAAKTLDQTDAPGLLAQAQAAYVDQLRAYATAARRLRRAVSANDPEATRGALLQLRRASSPSRASARAQRTAIESYNHRVERVQRLAAAVERERRRLDEELG